jgi:hypothetical protein
MDSKYKRINEDEELKQIKFCNIFSNIFAVLFIFDLIRGFFHSNMFLYINAIIWGILFISCLIGKMLSTLRLDIHYKK